MWWPCPVGVLTHFCGGDWGGVLGGDVLSLFPSMQGFCSVRFICHTALNLHTQTFQTTLIVLTYILYFSCVYSCLVGAINSLY